MVFAARPNNTAEALKPNSTTTLQDVAKCVSSGGRPPAVITWPFVGNGTTTHEIQKEGPQPGTTTVISFLTMEPSSQADGKTVTCRVEHESFQEADFLTATLSLDCECVCAHAREP